MPADPPELVAEIKHAIDDVALQKPDALAAFDRNPFQGIYSLTSIEPEEEGRVIPKMLGWQPALDALKTAGVTNPRFSSGFSLSKPAGGPALYWHRCATHAANTSNTHSSPRLSHAATGTTGASLRSRGWRAARSCS